MTLQRIARHKAVAFTYSVTDAAGAVVEQVDVPQRYVHGAGSGLLEKVEAALAGHVAGDIVDVTLSPDEGYGEYDPSLTFTDDLDNVPPEFRRVGAPVEMVNDAGEARTFHVSRIADGKLTVDGNHPFAGKTLAFRVTVTEVRDATPDEIAAAGPAHGGRSRLN